MTAGRAVTYIPMPVCYGVLITRNNYFSFSCRRKSSVMDFSAESIARQMTILDNELFQKVDVSFIIIIMQYARYEV